MEQGSTSPLLGVLISIGLVLTKLHVEDIIHTITYSVAAGAISWITHQVLNYLKIKIRKK